MRIRFRYLIIVLFLVVLSIFFIKASLIGIPDRIITRNYVEPVLKSGDGVPVIRMRLVLRADPQEEKIK